MNPALKVALVVLAAIIFFFSACRVTQRDVEKAVARCMEAHGAEHPDCLRGREVCKEIRCGPCTEFLNSYPAHWEVTIPLGGQ